jgi:integrase
MAGTPHEPSASAGFGDPANKPDTVALYRTLLSLTHSLEAVLEVLKPGDPVRQQPRTLRQACDDLIVAKAAKGVRDRYLVQLRLTMVDLCRRLGADRPIAQIQASDIEAWLLRPEWGTAARRSYLIDARTLWSLATARGYVHRNAALAVEMPRPELRPPAIHTPDQVRQVLEAARAVDLDVCRLLAVQYFAGLRPAEASRISDADILPDHVQVSGHHAKTRQRRLVTIHPALRAWLALGGHLPVTNRVRRYYRVRESAGVPWAHDVTRHSFVTYHLAHGRSASQTALEAGHTEVVLFRHYREVVTQEQADRFWAIRPT